MLLVPALMSLLGKANWWAPGPLRRLHERFGLTETSRPAAAAAVEQPARTAEPAAL
jgi:RND superfamily putative drug exporter